MKTYVLHDCDTGSDDAVALMMLLSQSENVVPVGITCVEGNTHLHDVEMNNLRILKLFDMLEKVPVFSGCASPLVPVSLPPFAKHIHGEDGLGGQPDFPPAASAALKQHLKIVATGPLTNLAMAVRLDPELPSRLSGLYIMGGTSHGKGNTTPAAEFNFHFDPESVFITLQSFTSKCEVFLITYEYTLDYPLTFEQVDDWLNADKNDKTLFTKMLLNPLLTWSKNKQEKTKNIKGISICDAHAMAIALDPSIGISPCTKKVCVELGGHHSRGHLITDHYDLTNHFFNVTCFDSFDLEKFYEMVKYSVKN